VKRCFKCGTVKPLGDFYPHPRMADGHLNKCKECTKKDVKPKNDAERRKRSAYEQQRQQRPDRKQQKLVYQRRYREQNPIKNAARNAVRNATRDGRLVRGVCEVCGNVATQAHHDDYSKPLEVRWLYFRHHREDARGQIVVVA
jgi:hypothetical protein